MLPVTIGDFDSNFEREPLIRPFGFTGGYMTEIWQTMSWMLTESGHQKVGLCTQNVLWSDAKVFQSYSEAMFSYHPYNGTSWTKTKQGFFELGEDYYDKSGGILTDSEHYLKMFEHGK